MKLSFASIVLPVAYSLGLVSNSKPIDVDRDICWEGAKVRLTFRTLFSPVEQTILGTVVSRRDEWFVKGCYVKDDKTEAERFYHWPEITKLAIREPQVTCPAIQGALVYSGQNGINCVYAIPGTTDTVEVPWEHISPSGIAKAFVKKCKGKICSINGGTFVIEVSRNKVVTQVNNVWVIDKAQLDYGVTSAKRDFDICNAQIGSVDHEIIAASDHECTVKFNAGDFAGEQIIMSPRGEIKNILDNGDNYYNNAKKCLDHFSNRNTFSLVIIPHVQETSCVFRSSDQRINWIFPIAFIDGCKRTVFPTCRLAQKLGQGPGIQLVLVKEGLVEHGKFILTTLIERSPDSHLN